VLILSAALLIPVLVALAGLILYAGRLRNAEKPRTREVPIHGYSAGSFPDSTGPGRVSDTSHTPSDVPPGSHTKHPSRVEFSGLESDFAFSAEPETASTDRRPLLPKDRERNPQEPSATAFPRDYREMRREITLLEAACRKLEEDRDLLLEWCQTARRRLLNLAEHGGKASTAPRTDAMEEAKRISRGDPCGHIVRRNEVLKKSCRRLASERNHFERLYKAAIEERGTSLQRKETRETQGDPEQVWSARMEKLMTAFRRMERERDLLRETCRKLSLDRDRLYEWIYPAYQARNPNPPKSGEERNP